MRRTQTAPAGVWEDIQNFLAPLLGSYPSPSETYVTQLSHRVTAFVLWAVLEMHTPLNVTDLFTDTLLRRFLHTVYTNVNTRTAYQSMLQRFVLHSTGRSLQSRHSGQRGTVSVYTKNELANARSWASSRALRNRVDAMAAVALAGGAGLRTPEIVFVRPSDVCVDGDTVLIDVQGANARQVAMRAEWTPGFLTALEQRSTSEYIVRPGTATSRWRVQHGAHVFKLKSAPDQMKLRDTWIVDMLDRLPFRIVTHLSGYASIKALVARYEPFSRLDDLDLVSEFHDVMKAAKA
ncbi:hypothetical protein C8E83_3462 [Frondihabitans australicus]|uniref:Phage integrase family protein n=2 Tax=Frondihabitans australicus TaxID=386892 RepID=A0A495IJZ8_9MICO|nr:hypothetical protein C8E83_3462 [Frondihabitans australicus]